MTSNDRFTTQFTTYNDYRADFCEYLPDSGGVGGCRWAEVEIAVCCSLLQCVAVCVLEDVIGLR